MKYLSMTLSLLLGASAAQAQDVPNLKGAWVAKGKALIYGTNPHHPGAAPSETTPRVRDYEFTFEVTGQEGRLAWGQHHSTASTVREPFAWAISVDGKSAIGTDTDGYTHMKFLAADRMELCYAQASVSPSKAMIIACDVAERQK
jgi:hypothetical protein